MTRSILRRSHGLVAILVLAACGDLPTAATRAGTAALVRLDAASAPLRDRLDERVTVARTVFVPCPSVAEGELVRIEGEARFQGNVVWRADQEHLRFAATVAGTGVGLQSGRTFTASERSRVIDNWRWQEGALASGAVHWSETVRLHDEATGDRFILTLDGRVVRTPDGRLVVEQIESGARCE